MKELTNAELLERIRIARRLAWVSKFHREALAELELEARTRNLKI